MLKKLGIFTMIFAALLAFTGCGAKKEEVKNVEGTLEEIMTKVYADIPEEERPMMLTNAEQLHHKTFCSIRHETLPSESNLSHFLR